MQDALLTSGEDTALRTEAREAVLHHTDLRVLGGQVDQASIFVLQSCSPAVVQSSAAVVALSGVLSRWRGALADAVDLLVRRRPLDGHLAAHGARAEVEEDQQGALDRAARTLQVLHEAVGPHVQGDGRRREATPTCRGTGRHDLHLPAEPHPAQDPRRLAGRHARRDPGQVRAEDGPEAPPLDRVPCDPQPAVLTQAGECPPNARASRAHTLPGTARPPSPPPPPLPSVPVERRRSNPPFASQLRGYFEKRNARRVERFKRQLTRRYRKRELFFLDETSKDGRALRRCAACRHALLADARTPHAAPPRAGLLSPVPACSERAAAAPNCVAQIVWVCRPRQVAHLEERHPPARQPHLDARGDGLQGHGRLGAH